MLYPMLVAAVSVSFGDANKNKYYSVIFWVKNVKPNTALFLH